ncbi:MAG: hypothetical protein U0M00_06420 [Clostridia bacterium]|nr:hypothetical protein [Clostridia bacterium]
MKKLGTIIGIIICIIFIPILAVIYLKNDTILSGTGTEQDPFAVKENWAWFDPYQEAQ